MNLDRNTNAGGRGKYALVNMRKLVPIFNQSEAGETLNDDQAMARNCFEWLVRHGYITLGNEQPTQQFFTIKFGDKFALAALQAYHSEVVQEVNTQRRALNEGAAKSLEEYARAVFQMIIEASNTPTKIPD